MARIGLVLGFAMLLLVPRLALTEARPAAEIAYDKSQSAVGQLTGRHLLTDHQGRELDIASLRGRPLVVSLVFTSCASVCPILTDHLRNQVERARGALGEESFNVLTFGFDASGDRPAQLAGFANTHRLSGIGGWYIASADERTTAAFLEELGFSFQAAAGGFDHVTQTTVLDPEGRVHAQIYGQDFPLPVLIEPLKELVLGKSTRSLAPADLWDRISFLCTVYDPARSAYRFDYGIFFGMFFGGFSLLITGLVILRLWLQRRRAIRQLPPSRRGMA